MAEFVLIDDYDPRANPKNLKPSQHVTRVPDDLKDGLKKRWLEMFEQCGLITDACEAIGISEGTVYSWRRTDAAFADAWDDIRRHKLIPLLEDAAFKRALSGKSDAVLIALLKNLMPDRYDEKVREPPRQAGIQISIVDVDGKMLGSAKSEVIDAVVVKNVKE